MTTSTWVPETTRPLDENGDDILIGGDGTDELRGNNGTDALYGMDGVDQCYGGAGEDLGDPTCEFYDEDGD